MKFTYEVLLNLYPGSWRNMFRHEMLSVFEQAADDRRTRGPLALWSFFCMEFAGLIAGAFSAWTTQKQQPSPSPSRWRVPLFAILGGLALVWLVQTGIRSHLAGQRHQLPADPLYNASTSLLFIGIITICIAFLALLALAFVWNARSVTRRPAHTMATMEGLAQKYARNGHPTIDELIAAQGLTFSRDPRDLLGDFGPEEEPIEDFLAVVGEWRGHTNHDPAA